MDRKGKLTFLFEKLRYIKWYARTCAQQLRMAGSYDDVNRVYWVPPRLITLVTELPYRQPPIMELGRTADGDWDKGLIPWDQYEPWQAFRHRYLVGGQWSETPWYSTLLQKIASGRPVYRCRTPDDLAKHFAATDELYRSIRAEGFRSQAEIWPHRFLLLDHENEVLVHITRDGHYVLAEGRHRLSIARLLNLASIPVKVARRHARWVDFRRQLLECCRVGAIRHPIAHPDLADIGPEPHEHPLEIIRQNLPPSCGSVIDASAGWGYACSRLEEFGLRCTALEPLPANRYFLTRLHLAEQRRFSIVSNPSIVPEQQREYDVLLLDAESCSNCSEQWLQAIHAMLHRLRMRLVFLHYSPPAGRGAGHPGIDLDSLARTVMTLSGMARSKVIGDTAHRTRVIMIWK